MNLFDPDVLARNSDPVTSHDAALDLAASGGLAKRYAEALEALRENPGLTSAELEALKGVSDGRIRKRLAQLKRLGKARNGDVRICTVTGRAAHEWYPNETAPANGPTSASIA